MIELHNLSLFALLLFRVLLLTGLAPAIAIAMLWEKFRVVKIGIEAVPCAVPQKLLGGVRWINQPKQS